MDIMASKAIVPSVCTEENPDVNECEENIPPGVGDVSGENEHLSDHYVASTPAPASIDGALKKRSRLSGLQSALTPILKYLNINNKGSSPETLKRGNGARLSVPSFSLAGPTASTGKTGNSGDKDASVCWLHDEHLPEVTLLNDTCDSTMQMTRNDSATDSMPTTPVTAKTPKSMFPILKPSSQSATTDICSPLQPNVVKNVKNNDSEIHPPELPKQTLTSTSTDFDTKMEDIPASMYAPERWLDDRYFPEITLLDVTHDSEQSPGVQTPFVNVKQDNPPVDNNVVNSKPSSERSGDTVVAEPGKEDTTQSEELSSSTITDSVSISAKSSFSEQSEKCVEENVNKASLEVTQDISMGSVLENSTSQSQSSGENMVKSQTSAEVSVCTLPANLTHDISASSTMSVQCASTSDVQGNTSLKNVTSELYVNPEETSNTADANNDELLATHDAESTCEEPQSSPEAAKSANRTFTTDQSPTHNKTLDLPPSNGNSPKAEREPAEQVSSTPDQVSMACDQVSTDFKNTTETSHVENQSSSADKESVSCKTNNATFDRHSLPNSGVSTHVREASAASFSLQNTFDRDPPPKQNGTITLSETNSSDTHQKTLDNPGSPSKVCNATTTLSSSEVPPPEQPKQNGTVGTTEATFEADPPAEIAAGADKLETEGSSCSGPPVKDSFSESLGHQSIAVEKSDTNTFNLDDTLDLKVNALVTSTPMPNSKMIQPITECGEGKTMGAQRKLYGEEPSNPTDQVPSNIVSDRRTFLTKPAVKSFLPPAKAVSHLLRFKPASTLQGKSEPSASGLPMTRQRAQAKVLKTTAASDAAQGPTGTSSSYNLRATTTGSKLPNAGLLRPPASGLSSGIQRAGIGLRPPSARTNAAASSGTEKLCGPGVTDPATKASRAKTHPLTEAEALPTAKRKKMDVPSHSSSSVAPTSSCDAANKGKNLKRPPAGQRPLPAAKSRKVDAAVPGSTAEAQATCDAASRARSLKPPANSQRGLPAKPQSHACAKCLELEEHLRIMTEENKRLKAELLKYKPQGEECSLP